MHERDKRIMKRRWLWQAIADGLLNSGYFITLQWFVVSIFYDYIVVDEKIFIFICLFGAIVNSIIYYKFLNKTKSVKEILCLTFVSTLVLILCMSMRFIFLMTFPLRLFQRELCNADGFLIMFSALIYLSSTITLRLFILIYEIYKVRKEINGLN